MATITIEIPDKDIPDLEAAIHALSDDAAGLTGADAVRYAAVAHLSNIFRAQRRRTNVNSSRSVLAAAQAAADAEDALQKAHQARRAAEQATDEESRAAIAAWA